MNLACTELRRYGADSIQVVRRLRAMIENLIRTLPEDRHAALQAQLALLDHAIEGIYSLPEELALARATDSQGLGGTPDLKKAACVIRQREDRLVAVSLFWQRRLTNVRYWHFADIERCHLFGRDGVNSKHGAVRPKSTRMTQSGHFDLRCRVVFCIGSVNPDQLKPGDDQH